MKNTKNYNLQKPDFNNVADIDVLNSNFDITDKSLSVPYRATLKSGTTDTFIVTTGINKTELSDLFKITVVFPSATTTETKLVIDSCAPVKIVKAGNSNKKVKAKEVCNLVYSNSDSVFMCASGSCDDVSFTSDKLLEGSSANNSDGEKVTGTMPNIGQQTATINAGGKVTISKGYHDGTGYVQSNSMGTQLSNLGVTLTSANQLVNGVKAVDRNGNLIIGNATIQSLGGLIGKSGSFKFDLPARANQTDVEVKHDFSQKCPNAKIIFGICDYYSPRDPSTLMHGIFIWFDNSMNIQKNGIYEAFYGNHPYGQLSKIDSVIILGNEYGKSMNNNTCRWWAIE